MAEIGVQPRKGVVPFRSSVPSKNFRLTSDTVQDLELRPKMSGVRQGPQAARSLVVARQRNTLHFSAGIFDEKGFLAV